MLPSIVEENAPLSPDRTVAVEEELQRILSSEFFVRSPRSQHFLEHVVRTTLTGRTEALKERTIGIELFQRDPAYDTGEDAIVRVKANEVRRRLAQFNMQPRSQQVVRIELSTGSYLPQFHWLVDDLVPPPTPVVRRTFPVRLAALGAGAFLLLSYLAYAFLVRRPPIQEFWEPVLASSKPVMLCLGHPVVYLLSRRVHNEFVSKYGHSPEQGPYIIKLAPTEVMGADIVPVPDQFIGIGDSQAAFRIGSCLQSFGKSSEMRIGNDVSFSDFKMSSVVLIGAFSNRWTLQISNQFRFVFDQVADYKRLIDRKSPGRSWAPPAISPGGKVTEDYAIVSRVFQSQSGQVMISAAGITQYGSQAAGEFLADPRQFRQVLVGAPSNWKRMNMQVVLKTKVFGSVPGPPEVIATYFW
jgi:hypothetical protein